MHDQDTRLTDDEFTALYPIMPNAALAVQTGLTLRQVRRRASRLHLCKSRQPAVRAWTEAELGYLAGIIDGEGHLGLYLNVSEARRIMAVVGVVTTDYVLGAWLKERFGGNLYDRPPDPACPYRKRKWEWRPLTGDLVTLLTAIRPFLLIKAEQADILLAFRATFAAPHGPPFLAEETYQRRVALKERIAALDRAR